MKNSAENNFFLNKMYKNAEECQNTIAVRYREQSITYYDLNIETELIAKKIKKTINDCSKRAIIIYQSRGIDFIKYIIAILKCGCYYVPIEDTMPIDRLKYIYEDVNAALIVSTSKIFLNEQYKILNPEDEIDIGKINIEYNQYMDTDLVYAIYTSGTSGRPKGVKIKYSNIKNLVYSFGKIFYDKLVNNINVGVISSFGFDASVKQIFCALFYSHTLVIADDSVRYFGRKIHRFHNENNIAICDMTPSHIKLMLLQKIGECSRTPYLLIGGEILTWSLLKNYKVHINANCTFINVYGPTECCVDVAYNIIQKVEEQEGRVPIGRPLNNTELVICDEKGRYIKETHKVGELYIFGEQVGAGYVNNISGGYIKNIRNEIIGYKTGDLAEFNDNKQIVILGRMDRQVKLNGYRIELDEISTVIEEWILKPSYTCLFNINDSVHLVAFVVGDVKQEEVMCYLKDKLASYMIPKKIVSINKFPVTERGKIDERILLDLYQKSL